MATQAIIGGLLIIQRRRAERKRKIWVRDWIRRRGTHGAHHSLLEELRQVDTSAYTNFLRMKSECFEELLSKVGPLISRLGTRSDVLRPAERLSVTLRFLATGDSYASLEFLYRIPRSTLSRLIPETADALATALKDNLRVPDSETKWSGIVDAFQTKWNFPNLLGAMDGKHIVIQCPPNAGSDFYNYKGQHSIVMLAMIDADYKFTYVDIGTNGRISDGGIFRECTLVKALRKNQLNVPRPCIVNGISEEIPSMIVADEAFPMAHYGQTLVMKPYARVGLTIQQRIFNYRLSRARRISENAFGILASRFRVFHTTILLNPKNAEKMVWAAVCLHNYLRDTKTMNDYCPDDFVDREDTRTGRMINGQWRTEGQASALHPLVAQHHGAVPHCGKKVRDLLCDYFNSCGSVEWQMRSIGK